MADIIRRQTIEPAGTRHMTDAGNKIARALPFCIYVIFLGVAPVIVGLWPALDGRWLYPLKIAAVVCALVYFWRAYGELRPLRMSSAELLWTAAAGVGVFVVWINLDLPWVSFMLHDPTSGYDPRDPEGAIIRPMAGLRLAGAALVVPLMEELFWRSLVMRWLDRHDFLELDARGVSLRALLASSIAFGFEHHLWLAGIIAGLAYGELYRRSGNLWLPILGHAVTNGLLGVWVLSTGDWRYW